MKAVSVDIEYNARHASVSVLLAWYGRLMIALGILLMHPAFVAAGFENPSCEKTTLKCLGDSEFKRTCAKDAIACTKRKSCTLVTNTDNCALLDLESGEGEFLAFSELSCELREEFADLNGELARLSACCAVKHETHHLSQVIPQQPQTSCLEHSAYSVSAQCVTNAVESYCEKDPSSTLCARACFNIQSNRVAASYNSCLCASGKSVNSVAKPCYEGCLSAEPQLPAFCRSPQESVQQYACKYSALAFGNMSRDANEGKSILSARQAPELK